MKQLGNKTYLEGFFIDCKKRNIFPLLIPSDNVTNYINSILDCEDTESILLSDTNEVLLINSEGLWGDRKHGGFKYANGQPEAGSGIIIGFKEGVYEDAVQDIESIRSSVAYLSASEIPEPKIEIGTEISSAFGLQFKTPEAGDYLIKEELPEPEPQPISHQQPLLSQSQLQERLMSFMLEIAAKEQAQQTNQLNQTNTPSNEPNP